MKLEILLLGKTKEDYLQQGINDFVKRLAKFNPVELLEIKVKKQSTRNDEQIKAYESDLLDGKIGPASFRVVLDSRGKRFSSEQFAEFLSELELRSVPTASFIIGGPLGLAAAQLEKADLVLSLSEMTFTHDMTRLLLLEQLYRAYTIKAGTAYHK